MGSNPIGLTITRALKIGACQASGEPRFPHFSTLPGGQFSASVSHSRASGGVWRARGTRAPWWRSGLPPRAWAEGAREQTEGRPAGPALLSDRSALAVRLLRGLIPVARAGQRLFAL